MPCRCTMRYSEESPIPNRWRISDVGVLVAPYRRPISSASSLLSLRRRRASSDREVIVCPPWTPSSETVAAGSTILNAVLLLFRHYCTLNRSHSSILEVEVVHLDGKRSSKTLATGTAVLNQAHIERLARLLAGHLPAW